jgi:two-component sensor histidine kinase/AmiR/NasT family two-component response regulator
MTKKGRGASLSSGGDRAPKSVATEASGDRRATALEDCISILIVDDEPKNLTVLRSILDAPDYRIVSAGSADEALLALIAEQFAVLILDVRMPGMNGFELAQIIKERKKTARVPIIFLTAYYGEDHHILDAYGAGAVDYLHKPVNATILRSKVSVFAELYRKTREAQLSAQALLAEVDERRRADEQLRELNETLENRVSSRTTELQDSRAQLKHAADLARLTYLSLDYRNSKLEVAENFGRIMGFELPSKREGPSAIAEGTRLLLDHIVANDRARFIAVTETAQGEEFRKIEYRIVGDDGKERWIESDWHIERGSQSRPIRAFVANLDITERGQSEEQRKLLMAEVNHRSKNLLSVIQAMVTQSARGADPQSFALNLSDRLQGLSASQDLLIKNEWGGIELSELVKAQLGHFKDLIGTRILVEGPAVRLTAAGTQAMGMAIHELATNAAKYGSLSNALGRVQVSWEINEEAEPVFAIRWAEEGGPRGEPPKRKGFGHLVVGRIAESALGGRVSWTIRETGALWELTAPVADALDNR